MTEQTLVKKDRRCYNCNFYKSLTQFRGWCKDNREGRKSIRVDAVDSCANFEPRGGNEP